jgi:hypothetical protein
MAAVVGKTVCVNLSGWRIRVRSTSWTGRPVICSRIRPSRMVFVLE